MEVAKQPSQPTQFVEDLLGTNFIDDTIWSTTCLCDVSIDTVNSAEVIEEHIFTFCRSDQHEFLNVIEHEPRKDDLSWYYDLDFLDSYHD